MKIYVASSWRNERQPFIVKALVDAGHDVYDFREPAENNKGFHWSEIDPGWKSWTPGQFIAALNHPVAVSGYTLDWNAMNEADACVMVMPCGRSAHIEAGFFIGACKPLYILLSDGEPELMYNMATGVCESIEQVIEMMKSRRPFFKVAAGL